MVRASQMPPRHTDPNSDTASANDSADAAARNFLIKRFGIRWCGGQSQSAESQSSLTSRSPSIVSLEKAHGSVSPLSKKPLKFGKGLVRRQTIAQQ